MMNSHLIPGQLYKLKERKVFYFADPSVDSFGLQINEIVMYISPLPLNEDKFAWFLHQDKKGIIHIGVSELHQMIVFQKVN